MSIIENISDIYRRMGHAAMSAGREANEADLIAVSKTVNSDVVREAYEAGLRVFGESKVQEAQKKTKELTDLKNISWHMIGHLQRNKAKAAVGVFDLIHSVDSIALLEALNRHAADINKIQKVLLQVKLSNEPTKTGAQEAELKEMVEQAKKLANIKVEGLMTIPPFYNDPEAARPYFKRLFDINKPFNFPQLSMGMTGDFEVAIKEGATLVRIGTAIFGERSYT